MHETVRYPLAYNPILEYWEKIQNREIRVCDKLYRTYKKVVQDIANPGKYHYSNKKGNHIIEFAENYCRHSKGKFGGKPVRLELWEKAHLATVFGFVDSEGKRQYRESVLIVAKKRKISACINSRAVYADGRRRERPRSLCGGNEKRPE